MFYNTKEHQWVALHQENLILHFFGGMVGQKTSFFSNFSVIHRYIWLGHPNQRGLDPCKVRDSAVPHVRGSWEHSHHTFPPGHSGHRFLGDVCPLHFQNGKKWNLIFWRFKSAVFQKSNPENRRPKESNIARVKMFGLEGNRPIINNN